MAKQMFVNLPVKDVAKAADFFVKLGFTVVQPGEDLTSLAFGDDNHLLLHAEPTFQQYTGLEIVDTAKAREVLIGLSADSRQEVNDIVDRAVAAGGQDLGGDDQGFMYMRAFSDLDGHQWSSIYMDMSAFTQ